MKHSTLKIILLCIFTATQYTAFAYSFSSTCSTGQPLYYNILSDTTVAVTYPNSSGSSYYQGFSKPTGFIQIPATVYHGGTNYRVVAIGANAFHSCKGAHVTPYYFNYNYFCLNKKNIFIKINNLNFFN
jgi:hypothetical protein